jgi:D-3-phosphoglycerate dehydrogenase
MNPVCLIVQPIHPAGIRRLHDAGLTPRLAASADMAILAHELGDRTGSASTPSRSIAQRPWAFQW